MSRESVAHVLGFSPCGGSQSWRISRRASSCLSKEGLSER